MSIKNRTTRSLASHQSGYTLIQMAIALMVIGILASAFIQVYSIYDQNTKMVDNRNNVQEVAKAMQKFKTSFGYYPCPAPMDVVRNNARYGAEIPYNNATIQPNLSTPIGNCANGVCVEGSIRNNPLTGTPLRVRVGAIPFRDLQLDEAQASDVYGSRIWYAVTENMCNQPTFNETLGGISIVNELGESQTNINGSGSFIIISPGPNKIGAYSKYGTPQNACGTSADQENCRNVTNPVQPNPNAVYLSTFEANGTTTFDDTVEFFSASTSQLWKRDAANSDDIANMILADIGIGSTTTPIAGVSLRVPQKQTITKDGGTSDSALLITRYLDESESTAKNDSGGNIRSDAYCDPTLTTSTGANLCFEIKDFAGNPATGTGGMRCAPGTGYPVGITSNGTNAIFKCSTDIDIPCPAGQVLRGFSNAGVPQCTTIASTCTATTITDECGQSITLNPAGTATQTFTYTTGGACHSETWSCQAGGWVRTAATGAGTCSNTQQTTQYSCDATATDGTAGQGCHTGTYDVTSFTCGGPTTSTIAQCGCSGTPNACDVTSTQTCPAPQTGGPFTLVQHRICQPGNTSILDPAFNPNPSGGGTCSCTLQADNYFAVCPNGKVRQNPAPALQPGTPWPADTSYGLVGRTTIDSATCTSVNPTTSFTDYCECGGDTYEATLRTPPSPSACYQSAGTRVVGGTSYDYKYDVTRFTFSNGPAGACTKTQVAVNPGSFVLAPAANFKWRITGTGSVSQVDSNSSFLREGEVCSCTTQLGSTQLCGKQGTTVGKLDVYECQCTKN